MVNKDLLIKTLSELDSIYPSHKILQKNTKEFEKDVIEEIKTVTKEL